MYRYYISEIENGYNKISVMDNDKTLGYINYKIYGKEAWLSYICVEKDYRGQGIGKNLLMLFENECAERFVKSISGKYYPVGERDSVVRKFYNDNGYIVDYEGYVEEIFKYGIEHKQLKVKLENKGQCR